MKVSSTPPHESRRRNQLPTRLSHTAIALALAVLTTATNRCDADLVVMFQPSAIVQGGTGTLEIDLMNTSMSTAVQISSFQLEISQPSGTGLTFTSATTGTAAYPFIFAGNRADDTYFGGSLFPLIGDTTIAGSDTVDVPDTFATLNAGQTVGLALVTFSADMTAPAGTVPISVVPLSWTDSNGTLLSEYPDLSSIPFTTDPGSIAVASASVPEPSALCLEVFGGLVVLAIALSIPHGSRVSRVPGAPR